MSSSCPNQHFIKIHVHILMACSRGGLYVLHDTERLFKSMTFHHDSCPHLVQIKISSRFMSTSCPNQRHFMQIPVHISMACYRGGLYVLHDTERLFKSMTFHHDSCPHLVQIKISSRFMSTSCPNQRHFMQIPVHISMAYYCGGLYVLADTGIAQVLAPRPGSPLVKTLWARLALQKRRTLAYRYVLADTD